MNESSTQAVGDLDETRRALVTEAGRKLGHIPTELVASHIVATTPARDFALHRAAFEAVRRRMTFAMEDGLRVAKRPDGGGVIGKYTTRREGDRGRARPYQTELESLGPLRGNCDCPDYLRSSLGLCKHLLVVLDDVFARGRRRRLAAAAPIPRRAARLEWEPWLSLDGPLDRLTGLRLVGAARDERVAGLFRRDSLPAPSLRPPRRLDVLRALDAALGKRLDASPAAAALVRDELARAEHAARCVASMPSATRALRTLKRKLYPYQREGVARLLERGRLLLADDMGLGKTTQAIAVCHGLVRAGRVRRGIVIAPASLKPQWLREWQETTDVPAQIVDGTPSERARIYRGLREGFLILGYEQLLRDIAHVHALAPELVVLDEAQRIKNYATKSAATVKTLTAEYRLVLTGTPMENRLDELASILDWVDDVAIAPKWRLVPWHTFERGDAHRGQSGARNLDALRARLAPCMLRRVRKDVLDQLPPRTDTRVPVEMTEAQRCEHDDLIQPIANILGRARRRPLKQAEFLQLMTLFAKQRMISNGLGQVRFDELWPAYEKARPDGALLEGLFAPKLAEVRRLIADLAVDQQRKVVVFSQWRRMLRLAAWSVRDVLEDAGLRAVFFTGAETMAMRTRSVVDFHDDPRARVMFLSDAGGVGLNLQRAASACINLELPWNPAVLEQRIGRIYRLGQTRPIDVYNLVNEYGIESRIAGLVGTKQAMFTGLFDGTADEVKFDAALSFLERAERLLPPDIAVAPAASTDSGEDVDAGPPESGEVVRTAAATPTALSPIASLRVERTADGGVRIEAPAELAGTLAAMFELMSKQLAAVAQSAAAGPVVE